MDKISFYLDQIDELKKNKLYDQAWRKANEALVHLNDEGNESWYMFYYQMADILAKEGKWFDALEKMGLCLHFLGRIGGISHEKFILRLLKKFSKDNSLESYVELVINSEPSSLGDKLKAFLY